MKAFYSIKALVRLSVKALWLCICSVEAPYCTGSLKALSEWRASYQPSGRISQPSSRISQASVSLNADSQRLNGRGLDGALDRRLHHRRQTDGRQQWQNTCQSLCRPALRHYGPRNILALALSSLSSRARTHARMYTVTHLLTNT
jgi:hypothetical protein